MRYGFRGGGFLRLEEIIRAAGAEIAPPDNLLLVKSLILVTGYSVFFSIILDNSRLDHQIVCNDLIWPTVLKELKNRSSHSGTSFFVRKVSPYVSYNPFFRKCNYFSNNPHFFTNFCR